MAMHKLGKLNIDTSDGFAFSFGDGKVHRLGFGRKGQDAEPEYNNEGDYMNDSAYADDGYASGRDFEEDALGGYRGRFHQPSRSQDDYDDGYGDGYDDGYADEDYDDGYYDDDRAYDDGGYYDDDGDYPEDGQYDDRYSDEDAGGYQGEGYVNESPLMRYADEHEWVIYVLLVVFPPLGIWLLLKRRLFDKPVRLAVAGVSALWFVALLVLLISALVSGAGDTTTNPPITLSTTPTPTVAAQPSATPGASAQPGATAANAIGISPAQTNAVGSAAVAPTPIAGGSFVGVGTAGSNTVLTTATGAYYHNNAACKNVGEGATSTMTLEVAQRNKVPCPICYPGQATYYATSNGKYYHSDQYCSEMTTASPITAEAAKARGQVECPVCIKHEIKSLVDGELRFADESYSDKSKMTVYATENGRYFHKAATCDDMKNGTPMGLLKAMLAGKKPCPDCSKSAGTMVYCTRNGKRYHNAPNCDGMENAYQVSLAEALVLGKNKCSICWGKSTAGSYTAGSSSSSGSSSGGTYVYATPNGEYYHTLEDCSGMKNAQRVSLSTMLSQGRAACPDCCAGADTSVYATKNGKYYHSYATCSGMKDAQQGTLAQAMALGKDRCPDCWKSSGSSSSESSGGSNVKVYATKNGTYYHTNSSCTGMSGASHITLSSAISAGKRACPTCAAAAERKVYSTSGGTYYHKNDSCSGMSGARERTLQEALTMGQKTCPVCIGGSGSSGNSNSNASNNKQESAGQSSGKYDVGTSGIKVYATTTGDHYHTKKDCSGMKDASYITLETALNYGKTACDRCADSADTKVYAVKGGKYYHYSKSCAGNGAKSGERAEALAAGYDPCPYCVTKTKAPEVKNTYKAGTSGINVWASINGKRYHADKDCAGSSASKVTLETALNYGKTACSSCASSASKTVYATGSDKYYHSSRTCAGSDAVSGSFAKALAMGKKECPVCIGGSESYEESDKKYSAPGDTKVYIDLDSEMLYYHKNKKCSDGGLSGGTGVMLDFVVDWGFRACPYCAPATSVQ